MLDTEKGIAAFLIAAVFSLFILLFVLTTQAQPTTTKTYDSATRTITIYESGNPKAELQLISNTDECLINCEAIIRIKPSARISIPSAQGSSYKWDFLKASDSQPGLESYSFEKRNSYTVNDYSESCNPYTVSTGNGTETFSNCTGAISGSHVEYVYEQFNFWGEVLDANSDYYIKIKGAKFPAINGNSVDWIPTFHDVQLNEWAWWNNSWAKRKPITISTGGRNATDYQKLLNVTYASTMKSDFADLIFTCVKGDGQQVRQGSLFRQPEMGLQLRHGR